jgi:L-fuconolactonase
MDKPWMGWIENRPAKWDLIRRDIEWSELRRELDGSGVAEVMLMQAAMDPDETLVMLELARSQPSIVGVVGWVSLSSAEATAATLDRLGGGKELVGIRSLHGWPPDGKILPGPQALEACAVLAERGLTLDLFLTPDVLDVGAAVVDAVPQGTYVINHLGLPPIGDSAGSRTWADSMSTLAERPNVFVKYSGWQTHLERSSAADVRPYVEHVLDEFGAGRVLFASNWPVSLVADDYATTYQATLEAVESLSEAERNEVFRGSAVRCYRLDG